jgi:pimeloyl-ACP methyl ester carboxylesterase
MDAAGSHRAAMLGLSEGGPLSTLFAATYPARTAALIMYGAYAKWIRADDYPWAPTREQHETAFEAYERHWGTPIGLKTLAPSVAKSPSWLLKAETGICGRPAVGQNRDFPSSQLPRYPWSLNPIRSQAAISRRSLSSWRNLRSPWAGHILGLAAKATQSIDPYAEIKIDGITLKADLISLCASPVSHF